MSWTTRCRQPGWQASRPGTRRPAAPLPLCGCPRDTRKAAVRQAAGAGARTPGSQLKPDGSPSPEIPTFASDHANAGQAARREPGRDSAWWPAIASILDWRATTWSRRSWRRSSCHRSESSCHRLRLHIISWRLKIGIFLA